MKKVLLFAFSFLTISSSLYGQERKGFIGLSTGPSIAIGDLSSKDLSNPSAGFADNGLQFDITFGYQFEESKFGVIGLLRGQANTIDNGALSSEFYKQFQPGVSLSVTGDAWALGGFLFGGFGSFPITEKANFIPKAMIGFLNSNSPEIDLTVYYPSYVYVNTHRASASAFSYLIGAGFNYELGDKWYLMADIDFLGSNPEFRDVLTTTSNGNVIYDTYKQSIATINFSLGIALRIFP